MEGQQSVAEEPEWVENEPKRFKYLPVNKDDSEPTLDEINERDLPLLANIERVRVLHYLIRLRFDMEKKVVGGIAVLFLRWNDGHALMTENENTSGGYEIIFDCCSIKVGGVSLLKTVESEEDLAPCERKQFHWLYAQEIQPLQFHVKKWSLNIFCRGGGVRENVIRIEYETLQSTPSLHWRRLEEGATCVYTPASPVNNRGLFPCQEPPSAMATWECIVELDSSSSYLPLTASDNQGEILPSENQFENIFYTKYYFYSSMVLPMSTFAIVIGKFKYSGELITFPECEDDWKELKENISSKYISTCDKHEKYHCRIKMNEDERWIPTRLFSLDESVVDVGENLSNFTRNVLGSAHELLGAHPFPRLDLVVMPKCFPSLGLSNPNMIFLSPSVFHGSGDDGRSNNRSCFSRISHEIAHSWFGLLIGALDWREEWLSEGFATYLEDILYKKAVLKNFENKNDFLENIENGVEEESSLRDCIRLANLQNEISSTDSEMQILASPPPPPPPPTDDILSHCKDQRLKNGLVAEKQFMQVHYLKGYFFLKFLAHLVGGENTFLQFLKSYLSNFHGQLVTSLTFLQFYEEYFRDFLKTKNEFISVVDFHEKFLLSVDLQEPWKSLNPFSCENQQSLFKIFPKCKQPIERTATVLQQLKENNFTNISSLCSLELLYLLEKILASENFNFSKKSCTKILQAVCLNSSKDSMRVFVPEVLHCFCELIIACKAKNHLKIVENFLLDHPAMGVYLYGELMISEKTSFQNVAKKVYDLQKTMLDPSTMKIIEEMIF